jgi:hypothetical protein
VNLAEIESTLPWGFHDAHVERIEIDWPRARLSLTLRLMMTERQEMDQRARVDVAGLIYCSIDAPMIDPKGGYYDPTPESGLWVDSGEGAPDSEARARLPATPAGCFLHWFFVQNWNRFIHVCARDAELVWLEPAPIAARSDSPALFPGDEVPDPTPDGAAR